MDASTAEASFFGVDVWNVDVWVWIVEARCWVLRNRAGPCIGLFWFFWVTCCTDCVSLWGLWLVWWCGWGQPSPNCSGLVFVPGCVFPRADAGGAGGGWGWCSCPYFENCIVDASIFVVFCCVTSY
jgi:hypothetical protein